MSIPKRVTDLFVLTFTFKLFSIIVTIASPRDIVATNIGFIITSQCLSMKLLGQSVVNSVQKELTVE